MVVMRFGRSLIARAAIAEIVPVENAGLFEQPHGAIHGRDGDARIDGRGTFMQPLDIGMIIGFGQHARDHAPLIGDPQTTIGAQRLQVDFLAHAAPFAMPLLVEASPPHGERRWLAGAWTGPLRLPANLSCHAANATARDAGWLRISD